jgi:hypothetical protein
MARQPDPLRALEDAGVDLSAATEEQRAVLARLSPEELEVLLSVKRQLDEGAADTEAHIQAGGTFW